MVLFDGWMNERLDGCMDKCKVWLDVWTICWFDGWMKNHLIGWMDGWYVG